MYGSRQWKNARCPPSAAVLPRVCTNYVLERTLLAAKQQQEMTSLEQAMATLQREKPSITEAMKNWCSILAAVELVRGDAKQPPHEMAVLLEIAKVVLACINAHELVSPDEWGLRHQKEGQAVTTQYQACHALAFGAKNAKLTKLYGRDFMRGTRCWVDGVATSAEEKFASSPKLVASKHTTKAFMHGWSKSISDSEGGGSNVEEDYSGLIWVEDLNAALQAKRIARGKETSERKERCDATEQEAQQLRAALQADKEAEEDKKGKSRFVELGTGGENLK